MCFLSPVNRKSPGLKTVNHHIRQPVRSSSPEGITAALHWFHHGYHTREVEQLECHGMP